MRPFGFGVDGRQKNVAMQPLAEDLAQVKLTPRAAFNFAFKEEVEQRESLFFGEVVGSNPTRC